MIGGQNGTQQTRWKKNSLTRHVAKSYPNDSGRGVARLDPDALSHLKISWGDMIEIEGADVTAAEVWRADRPDWNTDTVRIDEFTRQNADVQIGDPVNIQRAEPENADRLVLAPLEESSSQFDSNSAGIIKRKILERPVVMGDIVPIMSSTNHPFMRSPGQASLLLAVESDPNGVVLVTKDTDVELQDTPQRANPALQGAIYDVLVGSATDSPPSEGDIVDVPEGQCAHLFQQTRHPPHLGNLCCRRRVWRDGACPWHAEKPDENLQEQQDTDTLPSDEGSDAHGGHSPITQTGHETDDSETESTGVISDADSGGPMPDRAHEAGTARRDVVADLPLEQALKTTVGSASPRLDGANLAGTSLDGEEFINGQILAESTLACADLTQAHLQQINFSGVDLWGASLPRANLEGATLTDASLRHVYGPEATLEGIKAFDSDATGAILYGATFSGAKLQDADFRGAGLEDTKFVDANLEGADFTTATLSNADLSNSSLEGATLRDTDLRHADFSEAEVSELDLKDARIAGADFSKAEGLAGTNLVMADDVGGANLAGTDLEDATLNRAHFEGVDLTGASLAEAELRDATLEAVSFRDAILRDATLRNADLSEADLRDADLRSAVLWGADLTDADLSGANLAGAKLWDADLEGVTASDTDLSQAKLGDAELVDADLSDSDLSQATINRANLTRADLSGSRLTGAGLEDAVLRDADLTGTNLQNAQLRSADIEYAVLNRADLRGATLTEARLYQTLFPQALVDDRIDFDEECVYENGIEPSVSDVNPKEAATWVYRRLEKLHEENAMSDQARRFHFKKREVQRSHRWDAGEYREWFVDTLNRWLTGHGESLANVIGLSLATIVAAGLLFPFVGGVGSGDNTTWAFDSLSNVFTTEGARIFFENMYFSIITFTTIGYGDVYPASTWSKILVGVESLLGALLIALLVFVLGRRVAR